MSLMSPVIAKRFSSPLKGEITIPPDKSISHRGIIIGSLTKGKVKISNFSKGGDCVSTLNIFKSLGLEAEYIDDKTLIINSKNNLRPMSGFLNCGNSGTSMRLLAGYLAGQNFDSILYGDESLSKRPMRRVIEPLTYMGANIKSKDGKAPLEIYGSKLSGIEYYSKIASAQVKSSILLAGFHADGKTAVYEPYLSRNHSELMLEYFNADIKTGRKSDGFYASIKRSTLEPKDLFVPGDISSAAFFMVASAIVPNSDIIIKNVGLNETRTGIIDVFKMMDADIEILDKKTVNNEDMGDIRIKYSPDLKGCTVEGDIIPRLIDEIPVICVLAGYAKGKTVIKDAHDLKNKESDRIKCTAKGLSEIGFDILPTDDGFIITGKNETEGCAVLNPNRDHRLAMSYYVASLRSKTDNLISEFGWVNTSFPEFLELFGKLQN